MRRLIMTAALALLTTAAHAGVNTCEGTVQAGAEWTMVVGETGNYAPNGCRFATASKLGRRILAVCPNGSQCLIDVSLRELEDIDKLCPNPNARCMARDNPELFNSNKPARTIKEITNVEQTK